MAEARGFECLLFPEHTHIPASRETPHPSGATLPPEYSHTYDPFVALSAAAAGLEPRRDPRASTTAEPRGQPSR